MTGEIAHSLYELLARIFLRELRAVVAKKQPDEFWIEQCLHNASDSARAVETGDAEKEDETEQKLSYCHSNRHHTATFNR